MRKAIIVTLALAALPACADLPRGEWRTARPVALPAVSAPGLVYLPLDEEALAGVESLSEYRVVGDGRVEVPYRMVLEDGRTETRALTPKLISQGMVPQKQAQITADLGAGAPPANRVDLLLRGDNFRSRVRVEGSQDRSRWWLLTAQGIVYRHEGRFEQTRVAVPANEYRFLRITLYRLQGGLPQMQGVQVGNVLTVPRRLVEVPATTSRRENADKHATVLFLDAGRPTRDLTEARFEVEEAVFDRPVEIAAAWAMEGTPPKMRYEWAGQGRLQRLVAGKAVVLPLQIPVAQRVRVTIDNGDDRPLAIQRVTLWRLRRGLVFSADPAHKYELWYGRPNAPQPVYEIQRLPLATAPAKIPLAELGTVRKLPVKPPPPPPWSEQHRAFFWAVLIGVLVLLLFVIMRAVRGVKGAPPSA